MAIPEELELLDELEDDELEDDELLEVEELDDELLEDELELLEEPDPVEPAPPHAASVAANPSKIRLVKKRCRKMEGFIEIPSRRCRSFILAGSIRSTARKTNWFPGKNA